MNSPVPGPIGRKRIFSPPGGEEREGMSEPEIKADEPNSPTTPPVSRKRVYTDGVCLYAGSKRRIGAFAACVEGGATVAQWTRTGRVTNQTMELAGALAGLEALSASGAASGELHTTSHYVMSCMTRWLARWESTGWITKQRRPVMNGDALRRMADIVRAIDVTFVRVQVRDVVNAVGGEGDRDALSGMREARRLLEAAAHDGMQSGFEKRHNVLCAWSGG